MNYTFAGVPTNAIAILGEEIEIDLLPVDGSAAEWLLAEYPFFAFNLIPAETYIGTIATRSLSVGAQWVVAADVDDAVVHGITRALWHDNSRALLDGGHPKGKQIRVGTALKGAGIPLHPGAERYYRETGVID